MSLYMYIHKRVRLIFNAYSLEVKGGVSPFGIPVTSIELVLAAAIWTATKQMSPPEK